MNYILAGGWAALSTMLFSGICLYVAVRFALKAQPRRLAIIRALTATTVFSMIGGVAQNFISVMWKTTSIPELRDAPDFHMVVMQGLGEAMVPAVLGSMLLTLVWLLVAVGTRRLDDV
jgi:hypothetical protein